MDQLKRAVGRVRRRLWFQQFLKWLAWSWCVALAAASVGVVFLWWLSGQGHTAPVAAGALVGATVVALLGSWLRRPDALAAAVEVDLRFGLQERISSAWALLSQKPWEELTGAEQAVVEDALYQLQRLDVRERFPVRWGHWALAPLGPAGALVLLALVLPSWENPPAQASPSTTANQQQIRKHLSQLQKRIQQRRQRASAEGLKRAEPWLQELEKAVQQLRREKNPSVQKSLARLNDLKRQLQERKKQLASSQALRRQLNQLRSLAQGPLEKLVQALRQGDFKQALKQLEKLKQKLAQGNLSPEERKKLQQQLQKLQEKLQQMAQAQQQLAQQLRRQIQQLKQSGQMARAAQLEKQLQQLSQQQNSLEPVQNMAQELAQAMQALQEGQLPQALQSLENAAQWLQQLEQQLAEAELLDDLMEALNQCRGGMCQGEGRLAKPGEGLSRGRGVGFRPEERTEDNRFVDSRARVKVKRGSAVVTGRVLGPNFKGQVRDRIQQQVEAAKSGTPDPLSNRRLPRNYRQHTKEYFDALRQGP